jgi:mannose-6-phosphate isomerase-like protein (cupin superfamily)
MTDGIVLLPGQGRKLVTPAQEITFKVTGDNAKAGSIFEVVVPPGFDVGAHVHGRSEEFFYVLDGELEVFAFEPRHGLASDWRGWEAADGSGPARIGKGSCVFVPAGCPHAFTNPTNQPTRVLFQSSPPPDHERYFEQLAEVFGSQDPVDSSAVERLRHEYDIQQITPLRFGRQLKPEGQG